MFLCISDADFRAPKTERKCPLRANCTVHLCAINTLCLLAIRPCVPVHAYGKSSGRVRRYSIEQTHSSVITSSFSSQVGNYALTQRLGAYIWRGLQFFGVGFSSSMVGHTLTKKLVTFHPHPLPLILSSPTLYRGPLLFHPLIT